MALDDEEREGIVLERTLHEATALTDYANKLFDFSEKRVRAYIHTYINTYIHKYIHT